MKHILIVSVVLFVFFGYLFVAIAFTGYLLLGLVALAILSRTPQAKRYIRGY